MEHTFGEALDHVKRGFRIARAGWNGKGMYVELQRPDAHSKMSLPYLSMKTVDDKFVPWLPSQTDLLAEDWVVLVVVLVPRPTTGETDPPSIG